MVRKRAKPLWCETWACKNDELNLSFYHCKKGFPKSLQDLLPQEDEKASGRIYPKLSKHYDNIVWCFFKLKTWHNILNLYKPNWSTLIVRLETLIINYY